MDERLMMSEALSAVIDESQLLAENDINDIDEAKMEFLSLSLHEKTMTLLVSEACLSEMLSRHYQCYVRKFGKTFKLSNGALDVTKLNDGERYIVKLSAMIEFDDGE